MLAEHYPSYNDIISVIREGRTLLQQMEISGRGFQWAAVNLNITFMDAAFDSYMEYEASQLYAFLYGTYAMLEAGAKIP